MAPKANWMEQILQLTGNIEDKVSKIRLIRPDKTATNHRTRNVQNAQSIGRVMIGLIYSVVRIKSFGTLVISTIFKTLKIRFVNREHYV